MKDLHALHLLPWFTHIPFSKPHWSYSSYLSPSSLLTSHPSHYSLSKNPCSVLRAHLVPHSVHVGPPSKTLSLGGFLFTSIFWDIPCVQRLTPTCWANSVQFTQSRPTLCDPMDCSMPGLPVHQQLPVYSNSGPLSQWCHPIISSSVIPFSSHFQSFPGSGSFPVSQLFTSGGPKYWSLSFSISPSNEYSGLISLRMYWLDLLAIQGTVQRLLISWLKSPSAVILEPKKTKSVTVSIVSPSICHNVMGLDAMILVFWMLSFKPTFSFPLSLSSRGSLVLCFLP